MFMYYLNTKVLTPHSNTQHGSSSSHRLPTLLATFAAFALTFAVFFALMPFRSQFATFTSHFSTRPRFLSHVFADHLFLLLLNVVRAERTSERTKGASANCAGFLTRICCNETAAGGWARASGHASGAEPTYRGVCRRAASAATPW